jgi:hypothetical protein
MECRLIATASHFFRKRPAVRHKKILINYDQTHYLYENTQNTDKLPGDITDISAQSAQVLQKNRGIAWVICNSMRFFPCFFVHNTARFQQRPRSSSHGRNIALKGWLHVSDFPA